MKIDKIKILHLEDTETDAEHIHRILRKAEVDFQPLVVDTREEYVKALQEFMPDVVISDHSLPAFNSVDALDILTETSNKVPFILVTGAVSEEFAAEVMKKGADDYILKDRPHRLPNAVLNAVQKYRSNIKLLELQEEQQYLASIISSSNDAIISKNLKGIITSWNNAAEKIFGYTAQEAIGKSVLMLFPPDKTHEEREIIAIAKSRLPIEHYETERLKKDGARFYVSLTISPVIGPNGSIIGFSKIVRDITESKQAEAKLKASEKQFRAMIEKSADMISLAKPDGTFSYGSPSITKALGYELEEFFQLSAFDLIHAEDIPVLSQKIQDVLQTPGKSFYNQHRLKHKNGHLIWTEGIMTNMLHDPSVQALISNFRDITERRNTEQTLRENLSALAAASQTQASILDALPANIALLDKDGFIVEVNESWVRFGHENNLCIHDYSIGDNYIEISDKATGEDEETGKRIAEGIRKVISGTARSFELEYPCHSPTEQRWFKAEVAPLMKEHGKGAVVMHINITERKKAEEELRQSHVLIQKLTNQVPVAVYKFEMAPDGSMSFPFMSEGVERILPNITVEHIKQDSGVVFSKIHPDDLSPLLVSIEESRQNLTLWKQEYRTLEPDGQYKWMLASSRPEKKADGTVVWYGFIQDINKRKQADLKLEKLATRLMLATDSAKIGIWDWDILNDVLVWDNSMYEIYGITPEKFNGAYEAWSNSLHPDDKQQAIDDLQLAIDGTKEFRTDFRIIWPTNEVHFIEAHAIVTRDAEGKAKNIIGVNRDITEYKKAQAAIHELNEKLEEKVRQRTAELTETNIALEAFSYSVSHDLRSPARAVVSFSNIITKEYGNTLNEDVKELFTHVESGGKRMSAIIDDLLLLAKFGKQKLRIAEVDMNALFKEVWDIHSLESPNSAKLQLKDLPKVQADSSLLRQVVVNLISNAVKYSSKKENSVVKVGFEQKDDKIIFSVTDNGAGFDMKNYNKLFSAFQRLHGTSEFEGTGVGLSLVKNIIDRHGGQVWAEGKVNEGATFYFSLVNQPIIQNEPNKQAA